KEMGYNDEAQQATIVMSPTRNNPTGAYVYDMDPDTWGRMAADRSAGKAYNAYIRRAGNTSVDVAVQCDDCGRYYGTATTHACRAAVSGPSRGAPPAPTSSLTATREGASPWTPRTMGRSDGPTGCLRRFCLPWL